MILDEMGFMFNKELQQQIKTAKQFYMGNRCMYQEPFINSVSAISKTMEDFNVNGTLNRIGNIWSALLPDISPLISQSNNLTEWMHKNMGILGNESIERMIKPLYSPRVWQDMDYNKVMKSISGLNEIFNSDYERTMIRFMNQWEDVFSDNLSYFKCLVGNMPEDGFEDCFISEDGSVTCDGEIFSKEEVQEKIFDVFSDLIDNIYKFKKDFQETHKIVCFVFKVFIHICLAFDITPTQPLISGMQKIESTINDYSSKYYVKKESVKVYKEPTSRSETIERVSYGETVIAEESCKGWIKVTISIENKIYHGWIAKCNLLNYEKAKFNEEELEYEIK